MIEKMDQNVICHHENSNEFQNELSLGHLLLKNLSTAGDKIVLISGISSEKLSAEKLLEKILKVAKALRAAGINPGDVVSIVSENRFEFAEILFGCIFVNCTFAPINMTYSEREIEHALNLSKPKIIITSPFASVKVIKVAKTMSCVNKIVLIEEKNPFGIDVVLFKDFLGHRSDETFSPSPVNKAKAVSIILCSSGTTGLPKGVQLSQNNLIAATRYFKNTAVKPADLDDEDPSMLGILPWFHAFGLTTLVATIAGSVGKMILLPKFEEKLFLGCINNYRCNVTFIVPPLMVFFAKHPIVDGFDLSSLKLVICGAAPLSKELKQAVTDRLNNPKMTIRQGYGMSELSLAVLLQTQMLKPGSVGEVSAGSSVKVIDESGKSLGPNQRGELCFKGNQMMLCYIDNDKATKDTIDNEGWLHTGDVGYYDDDQQFYIVDRIKELIKWKGYQVPPAEIEGLLLTHEKIKDAAVIGIPDDVAGELPLAFVVKADDNLTDDEIIQFIAKTSSPAKRLHGGVRFIDAIPRNPSGKILRRELRELFKRLSWSAKL